MLIFNCGAEVLDYRPEVLMAVFNLTHAEARLACALAKGRALATYAERASVSRNTARNQLAQTFAQTGMSRQVDLVALVVRTVRWLPRKRRPRP